jgi:hypothetical protein
MDAVPPGSYLAISIAGSDLLGPERQQGLDDVTDQMIQQDFTYRTREQVARFFAGTDLVEPGLVRVEEWRPESGADPAARSVLWGAVGRKR